MTEVFTECRGIMEIVNSSTSQKLEFRSVGRVYTLPSL